MTMRRMVGRAIQIVIAMATAIAAATPANAAPQPPRTSEAIVQFHAGVRAAQQRATVRAAGGVVVRDLHVIRALGVRMAPRALHRLAASPGVRVVSANAPVRPSAAAPRARNDWDTRALATAFPESTRADKAWTDPTSPATGAGVTVAVLDTGIAGQLPDFRASQTDPNSRVIASVVTNPDATTATDAYGHGTHVAGLLAGNGRALPASDPLVNRYVGAAPQANLVSVKVSDDHGNATVMDVIAGLQFVVDHGVDYGIRVVNLSLASAAPASYRVDPLDPAVGAGGAPRGRRRAGGPGPLASSSWRQPATAVRTLTPSPTPPPTIPTSSPSGRSTTTGRSPRWMTASPRGRAAAPPRTASSSRTSSHPGRTSPRRSRPTATSSRCARRAWSTSATSGSAARRWRPRSSPASRRTWSRRTPDGRPTRSRALSHTSATVSTRRGSGTPTCG